LLKSLAEACAAQKETQGRPEENEESDFMGEKPGLPCYQELLQLKSQRPRGGRKSKTIGAMDSTKKKSSSASHHEKKKKFSTSGRGREKNKNPWPTKRGEGRIR